MKKRMPKPCATWANKLAATYPGSLSPSEQAALEEHLKHCTACAATRDEYYQMDALIRAFPSDESLAHLSPPPLSIWEPGNYDVHSPAPALDKLYKESASRYTWMPGNKLIPHLRWATVFITLVVLIFLVTLIWGIYHLML